jgi:hypothetical protein
MVPVVFATSPTKLRKPPMPATQKQIEANRRNARKSTGPKSPNEDTRTCLSRNESGNHVRRGQGKIRAALNGWRHGLTGQVLTMAQEDRDAFETFARELRNAWFPVGPLETQIAQAIAEDEWRLNRARAIENNVIALGHSSIDGEIETINTQLHAAMTQARVFWRNPEKFALLSLQTERKAALEAALEEAAILAELAESKNETYDPAPDFAHRAQHQNGFGFSTDQIHLLLARKRRQIASRQPHSAAQKPHLLNRRQA